MSYGYFLWRLGDGVRSPQDLTGPEKVLPIGSIQELRGKLEALLPTFFWDERHIPNFGRLPYDEGRFEISLGTDEPVTCISLSASRHGHDVDRIRQLCRALNCTGHDLQTSKFVDGTMPPAAEAIEPAA